MFWRLLFVIRWCAWRGFNDFSPWKKNNFNFFEILDMLYDSGSDACVQMRFFTKQMKDRDERPVYWWGFSLMECGSKQKPARESKYETKCNTVPYWPNLKATSSKDKLKNERKRHTSNFKFDYPPKRNIHQVVKFSLFTEDMNASPTDFLNIWPVFYLWVYILYECCGQILNLYSMYVVTLLSWLTKFKLLLFQELMVSFREQLTSTMLKYMFVITSWFGLYLNILSSQCVQKCCKVMIQLGHISWA